MVCFKAFKGVRPPKELAKDVASRPYDVLNSEEAKIEAKGNDYSLLRIIKPEIEFEEQVDEYSQEVYDKAVENFKRFQNDGWLIQDNDPHYYIYAQTMGNHTQYGLVGCASVDDYLNNTIKKHELTRKEKEDDRMKHVLLTEANMEPVFFSYNAHETIDSLVSSIAIETEAEYQFTAEDGVRHQLWIIEDGNAIDKIDQLFQNDVESFYVADGHHRTAAAARVGAEKRKQLKEFTGKEEFNYFLAVVFPDNQLNIIDYNRVVKDLNGFTAYEFKSKLEACFTVECVGEGEFKPTRLHEFGMYLEGKWYSLVAKGGTYDDNDPIKALDVTVLSKYVLDDILGIKDLRTDKRIDFVGGIRGLGELKRRVDNGEMKVAFALYPVSMKQLITISDTGNIMPPKTTWFEPKLRSGLVIHKLND